jgi:PiT family inorganic phosphate transporter
VIGVGIARSAKDLNLDSIKKIITSWLVTIPIGAAFTVLFFVILRLIFGV